MSSVTAQDPGLNLGPRRSTRVLDRGDTEGTVWARAGLTTEVPPATDCTEVRPEEGPGCWPQAGLSQANGAAGREGRLSVSVGCCQPGAQCHSEPGEATGPGPEGDSRNVSHLGTPSFSIPAPGIGRHAHSCWMNGRLREGFPFSASAASEADEAILQKLRKCVNSARSSAPEKESQNSDAYKAFFG